MHAREALEVAFKELTGKERMGPFAVLPERIDEYPLRSTLGRIDISDEWADANNGLTGRFGAPPAGDRFSDLITVDGVAESHVDGLPNGGRPPGPALPSSNGGDPTKQAHPDHDAQ
jgi:hypothetical protein